MHALLPSHSHDAWRDLHVSEVGDGGGYIVAVNNDAKHLPHFLALRLRHEAVFERWFPAGGHALSVHYTLQ